MRKPIVQYLERVHIVLAPLVAVGLVYAACMAWGPGLSPDSVSYLSAGISLADGHGFYLYDGAPYLEWPPLVPLLAAIARLMGIPPEKAIVVTNALLFALTVFLTGALLRRYLRKRALSAWGAWAVALSPALVIISCQVLSDMIFTSSVVALIYALDQYAVKEKIKFVIIAGMIACVAFLARYIGFTLILSSTSWLLLRKTPALRRRVWHTALFVAIGATPGLAWLARNLYMSSTVAGHHGASQYSIIQNLYSGVNAISAWFLTWRVYSPVRFTVFVIGGLVLLVTAYTVARRYRHHPVLVLSGNLLTHLSIYILSIALIASIISIDRLDQRFLVPFYAPTVILLALAFDQVLFYLSAVLAWRRLSFAILLVVCAWLLYPIRQVTITVQDANAEGTGLYSSQEWATSPLIAWLKTHELLKPIYSNAPDVIYYETGKSAKRSPQRKMFNSPQGADDNLDLFVARTRSTEPEWYLVWFYNNPRSYLYDRDSLLQVFCCDMVSEFADGDVYLVNGVSPPAI